LVIANLSLGVDLSKLSVCHISITFLGLRLLLGCLIILTEILLEVDSLLKPVIAAPSHGNLIKVFKKRDEPNEISILKQLLLNKVDWDLDILKVVPFKKTLLFLS
jgi:hypothetical protein